MKRLTSLILAILLLFVGTAFAEVEGVTPTLYETGLNLMRARVSAETRASTLASYENSIDGLVHYVAAFSDTANSLSGLMPMAPAANDQKFIEALLSLQLRIDRALVYDALDLADTSATADAKRASSDARWQAISALVESLTNAATLADLESIIKGDALAAPTAPVVYAELTKGAKGDAVKDMQLRLKELGYLTGTADGSYGAQTVAAVMLFEQTSWLTVDGVADPAMQQMLFAQDAFAKGGNGDFLYDILTTGSTGTSVRSMQTRLKELGYLTGTADGSFGNQTLAAVKLFQNQAGLSVTGIADAFTQGRLFAENAPRKADS